ncbi:hypothetical protein NLI96_g1912 [Meripilus lineatus]|uniref:DUF6534 domain-containing protein n=1 Tax=Meripilus lineatus TaxID=2056292 RepID=A0AAD5VB58_9APHY|nr:hypothetical protein NLI96_g1912 [Physisporinus lineatus]
MSQLEVRPLRPTLGAVMLGSLVSAFFAGIVTMQVFLYYRIYPKDRMRFKVIVGLVWFLDAMHTAMVMATNWIYLIDNFGDSSISDYIPWLSSPISCIVSLLTGYTHVRVPHLYVTVSLTLVVVVSKNNLWITLPIILLATLRVAFALVTTAQMLRLKSYSNFTADFNWVITMGLSMASAVDVLIAVAICWFLNSSRTGFSSMDGIIDSITLYTVENGMLTCLTTLISLICWVTMPHNLVFLGLHFAISKLYANAFLATLNARKVLRGRSQGSSDRGDHAMPVLFPENYSRYSRGPYSSRRDVDPISTKVQINVEKTIEREVDGVPSESLSYMATTPSQIDSDDIGILKTPV